jgi:hypothetical protein
MVNTTLLQLFIFAVILVSLGQLYLATRYILWPRLQRVTHCPWCWQDAGIAHDFPAPWSSTICPYHDRQMRTLAGARRRTRHLPAASTTKPAAVVLQAEEVAV